MAPRKPSRPAPPPDWLDADAIAGVKAALAARRRFRDGQGPIELVQTHISSVFLTRRFVFKFKRAVDVGFADFRALARRRHFCREEVRLNRRLAPDVYLGVVPLRWDGAAYSFGTRGRVADYAVVMKRLPAGQMLDARIRAGAVTPAQMDALADRIADFHRRLRPARRFASVGSLATWRRNWAENFAQTEHAIGVTHSAAQHASLEADVAAFLRRAASALRTRVTGGRVRNGHGDLRCEHIKLGRPIRIIDCVEFTERFRYGDVANDLAFLLMDLCHFGRADLARQVLARWVEATGDRAALPLIPFYACYRAYVRGKVLGFRLLDRTLTEAARDEVVRRARRFFALARAFAEEMAPPALVMACGLMGSGKSHLANALGGRTGAAVLASDRIRKELTGTASDRAAFGAGIYSPAWTERTYGEMFARAAALLAEGHSVILDATFSRQAHRDRALALARRCGAEPWLIECTVPDAVALERLRRREARGTSLSDGRPELYLSQQAAFEPVRNLPAGRYLVVNTDRPKEVPPAQVLATPGFRIPGPTFSLDASSAEFPLTGRVRRRPPTASRAAGRSARPD